jgi:hypothetical protein
VHGCAAHNEVWELVGLVYYMNHALLHVDIRCHSMTIGMSGHQLRTSEADARTKYLKVVLTVHYRNR